MALHKGSELNERLSKQTPRTSLQVSQCVSTGRLGDTFGPCSGGRTTAVVLQGQGLLHWDRMKTTDPRAEFERLMGALEDWYVDSVAAVDLDSAGGGSRGVGGHRVLRANKYPGPDWRREFAVQEDLANPPGMEAINRALRDELYGLDHGPSRSGPASGLHRGTREWKLAIAQADGSLRAVARRFGVSHTEVRRLRFEFPKPA